MIFFSLRFFIARPISAYAVIIDEKCHRSIHSLFEMVPNVILGAFKFNIAPLLTWFRENYWSQKHALNRHIRHKKLFDEPHFRRPFHKHNHFRITTH